MSSFLSYVHPTPDSPWGTYLAMPTAPRKWSPMP